MADLYLVCGVPASGKTTFLKTHLKPKSHNPSIIVSRDKIRFSLVKEGEPYFSKEKEVYRLFWGYINSSLAQGHDVFADQTSLTPKSRKYLLDHVTGYEHVNAIWIKTDINTCIERNSHRTGREHVPPRTIINMWDSFTIPSFDEGFYRIFKYENGKLTMKEKPNDLLF